MDSVRPEMTGGMTTDDAADNDEAAAAANSNGTRSIITAGSCDNKGNNDKARPTTGPQRMPGTQKISCVSFLRELIGLLMKD